MKPRHGWKICGKADNGSLHLELNFAFVPFLPDLPDPFCPFSMLFVNFVAFQAHFLKNHR